MDTSEVFEYSKENIKPLKSGRKPSALSTALQAERDDDLRHNLIKKRDEYEMRLRSYEGDDPLQIWFEYVEWVEQNFPKNGREGNFQLLLENCLSEFKDMDKYYQDVRYISLWIKYLQQIPTDPIEMYKQIHAHGIGTQCALFYDSWAQTLERTGDFKRADRVYLEGIKRRAQPVEDLKLAHDRFQVRVARRALDDNPVSPEHPVGDQRSAMALLRPHGRKNAVNNVRTGKSIQRPTPGVLMPQNTNMNRNGNIRPSGGLKVFNDENADANDVVSDHIIKTSGPISRKDHIVKENVKKPGRWNEGKLKFNVPNPVQSRPSYLVHVDENADVSNSNQGMVVDVNALKPRKYDDELSIPVALFEPPDPTKRPMYPKHKVYSGGTEFSLEELRAIKYLEREEREKKQQLGEVLEDKNADRLKSCPKVSVVANTSNPVKYEDELHIPVALFEPLDPTKRPMYQKHKVYPEEGKEFSLEELRAFKYLEKEREEEERKKQLSGEQLKLQEESIHMDSLDIPQSCQNISGGTVVSIDEIQLVRSTVKDAASNQLLKEEFKFYTHHSESQNTSKLSEHYGFGSLSRSSEQLQEESEVQKQIVPTKSSSGPSFTMFMDEEKESSLSILRKSRLLPDSQDLVPVKKTSRPLFSVFMDETDSSLPVLRRSQQLPELETQALVPTKASGPLFSLYVDDEKDCSKSLLGRSQQLPELQEQLQAKMTSGPSFSLYVDEESNGSQSVLRKSQQLPESEPQEKVQAKKTSGPAFTLYVDDESDMSKIESTLSLLRSSDSEEPKLPPVVMTATLPTLPSRGFLANQLKVKPRTPEMEPEHVEGLDSRETSTHSNSCGKIEQSFTVNTKEALNAVHKLWESPQFDENSFVQLPPQQSKPTTFKIHMDESMVQERYLTAVANTDHVPEVRAQDPENPCPRASAVTSGARQVLSVKKSAGQAESRPVEADQGVFKLPLLPFVPSPGRTRKELEEMAPEDKENGLSAGPKPMRPSNLEPANILQPSRHIPFQPMSEWQDGAQQDDEDDLGVNPLYPQMCDVTCTTQVLSKPLFSSTPFCKNSADVFPRKPESLDPLDGSYCAPVDLPSCPDSAGDVVRPGCEQADKAVRPARRMTKLAAPGRSMGDSLSIIMEVTSSSSSSSAKGSTRRTTSHWTTLEAENREEHEQKACVPHPFLPSTLTALLDMAGFPNQRHEERYLKLPAKLPPLHQKVILGNEKYLVSNFTFDWNGKILAASEAKTGRLVSMKVRKSTCPWEFYICEEIHSRLSHSTIALYFMNVEKAFFYSTGSVLLSDHSEYGNLLEIVDYFSHDTGRILTPTIVTYWTYEMLDITTYLHKCHIIHGNLWCENFYLHNIPFEMNGTPSLKLRNFEHGIDMTLFPPGTKFNTTEVTLSGLQELFKQPCSYEMDFFKLAASVYYLVFSNYDIKLEKEAGLWTCRLPSSDEDFLDTLFAELLNNEMPDIMFLKKAIIQQSDEASLFRDFREFKKLLNLKSN